jgi:hypothetical protein
MERCWAGPDEGEGPSEPLTDGGSDGGERWETFRNTKIVSLSCRERGENRGRTATAMGRAKKTGPQQAKSGNRAKLGFEEKLWSAADKMRGHNGRGRVQGRRPRLDLPQVYER